MKDEINLAKRKVYQSFSDEINSLRDRMIRQIKHNLSVNLTKNLYIDENDRLNVAFMANSDTFAKGTLVSVYLNVDNKVCCSIKDEMNTGEIYDIHLEVKTDIIQPLDLVFDCLYCVSYLENPKAYVCRCNNCGTFLIDENPQVDAVEFYLDGKEVKMELLELEETGEKYWGCPYCHTDAYLEDLEDL